MKIYDTALKAKVEFKSLVPDKIGMYVCGPTVYDSGHLGHGRSAVCFDVIRRYFEYRGYEVKFVFNYTDIEDKMIKRAEEEGISVPELAERIIPEYKRDYDALGVKEPSVRPRATEHVGEMLEIIERLESLGFTYVLDDGVYFDVSKFSAYGRLSGQDLDALQMGARVEVKESKQNPQDFVLWKFKKENEVDFWLSKWGDGRPGWHIECSAMSWKHLGEKFDLHGGGLDLTFPHHECEVAQSCACFGENMFAQHWLHNGFVTVDNEKMSKSLGNFFTLKDIFAKYDAQIVRFMFLQTHYRNPINFSDTLLEQSRAGLQRLHDFVRFLENCDAVQDDFVLKDAAEEMLSQFELCMDNDFDTAGALGAIFTFMKLAYKEGRLSAKEAASILEILKKLDTVLAVIFNSVESDIDAEIEELILERNAARAEKDFARADEIRDQLLLKGIVLEDSTNGTIWKKA